MKILVIRTGALGDTILLSPVLQNLRAAYPGAEIHVLGHPERVRLLLGSPNADRGFSSEDGRWLDLHRDSPPGEDTVRWISKYGLALSYSSRANGVVERNLRQILGNRFEWGQAVPPDGCGRHCVEFLLDPLANRGIPARVRLPVISIPGMDPGWANPRNPLFVVHPGAGSPKKRLSLELFLRAANGLERETGSECRFILGPADMDLREGIENAGRRVRSGTTLDGLVGVLRGARGFLGHDSGVSHLAAALGVPTVAIFTSTDPVVWRPLGPRVLVIDVRDGLTDRSVVGTACDYLKDHLDDNPVPAPSS